MKRIVRLTENDIRRMVNEAINEVDKDYWDPAWNHLAQDMENDYRKRHPEEFQDEEEPQQSQSNNIIDQMKAFWNNLSGDKKNILIRIVLAYITKGKFRL